MNEIDRSEARDRWEAAQRIAMIAQENVARGALRYIKLLADELFPDMATMSIVPVKEVGGWAWTGFGYTLAGDICMLGVDRAEESEYLEIQRVLLSLTLPARRVWSSAIFEGDGAVTPYLDLNKVTREPE